MKILLALILSSSVVLASEKQKDKVDEQMGKTTSSERIEKTNQIEQSINDIKIEILNLKKKAKNATGQLANDMNTQIANLEKDSIELSLKAKKLKSATGQAWEDMKDGIQAGLSDISSAFNKAKSRIDSDSSSEK